MLPRRRKLNLRQHPRFFSLAKRQYFSSSTLFYLADASVGGFLITVVVPKKVSTKASRRNYLRRVVYQLISDHLREIQDKNIFAAIVLRPEANKIDVLELKKEVVGILKKIESL